MTRKSELVKQLRLRNIPIPQGAKVSELEHLEKHWLSNLGWILRRFKVHWDQEHPSNNLPMGEMVWVPDSNYARDIVQGKKCMVVNRAEHPPKDMIVIEIPKNYESQRVIESEEEE
jgi:hypothetical protein